MPYRRLLLSLLLFLSLISAGCSGDSTSGPPLNTETVAAPTFAPEAGTYSSPQNVTITCTTTDASIHYTLDGSDPDESSALYSSPTVVSATTTIKARAYKSGMNPSPMATAVYTINIPGTVASPTFDPPAGTYASAQDVTMNCATTDASIYYTLDGSDPDESSTLYSSPLAVPATTTIKARAYKSGMNPSPVATAVYTINIPETVASPTFDPPAGTYTSAQDVTMNCATTDASIYYTLDGSDPDESSTLYSSPLAVPATTTIKARAYKSGMNPSPVATAVYTINIPETVASPTFDPPAGTFASAQDVTLDCTTMGAIIYYTLDGSDPDEFSAQYISPIAVSATTTIRARAYKSGMNPSPVATGVFVIDLPDVAEPQISPQQGIYPMPEPVTITCSTPGATIYYTLDGTIPDQGSSQYLGTFTANATLTIKARAYAVGMDPSPVATVTLTILPGLVAYYPLQGNAHDVNGGHDGTMYGPVNAEDRYGNPQGALEFDGIDDYIELADESSFDLTDFTISMWVRIETLPINPGPHSPGKYTLINKGADLGNFTSFLAHFGGASYCSPDYAHKTSQGNWSDTCMDARINLYNWYHVVMTRDTEVHYYVNGTLMCTSSGMPTPLQNDDNVLIGKLRGVIDEYPLKGFLDDIRFYDRALSSTEIQQLYDAEQ